MRKEGSIIVMERVRLSKNRVGQWLYVLVRPIFRSDLQRAFLKKTAKLRSAAMSPADLRVPINGSYNSFSLPSLSLRKSHIVIQAC